MITRWRLPAVALLVGCAGLLLAALVVVLRPDRTPHPEAVTATVTRCGFELAGSAQVQYSVTNGDRGPHGYRVEMLIRSGNRIVGSGEALLTRVESGRTESAQGLVPLRGDPAGATCEVRARPYDGLTGHHAPGT